MQCQVDLIATLAVIPLTRTDMKCVALSLVSGISTSSPVRFTPYIHAVYLLHFNLFVFCVYVHLDIFSPLVKGYCYFNLR